MTEFRLSAARPGSGIRSTLTNARIVGSNGEPVDIELEDAQIAAIRPANATGPTGERTNLDGRWVLPGLWDHHVHFTQVALASRRLDLTTSTSAASVVSLVDGYVSAVGSNLPAGETLVGTGFRDAMWPDPPNLDEFDRAAQGRSVVLIGADLHCVWLNRAALIRFGHAGHPTGMLREEDAFAVSKALRADDIAVDEWARDAADAAAARGVVGIVDFEMAWNLEVWKRRALSGGTALRVRFGIYPADLDRALAERLSTGQIVPHTHGLVEVGSLKVITDGSLNTRSAYCDDDYEGLSGRPDAHGVLTVPQDELIDLMRRARAGGLHSAIHAIGDRANALALDAFAATGATGSIEHAQLLRDADVARFAALGVTASVQPEHAMDDRDAAERLWPGRTRRAFVLRSLLDAGATLALGSDAPVAPLDPWIAMSAAVGRSRQNRAPWHPEQSITVSEALAATTRTPNDRVATGHRADLAIVDANPLSSTADELRRMPVAATLLNGRFTHSAL
ncbi:amidohydrolase [Mycetocola zhadangensis]|uniref:Amidohydrolase n=1 Tax=Mycetocola zhadangensis TaxID=1164595 RepID=A0A3L7JDG7_9MICO|nr:amidohydrolase family protein [Mycetocola zhadangensis]RLQ86522.1 amidohydrolase [Mycetocola zhadangensis]GGE86939.1 amidohydrolase [Mycetocola zhadangensis]